MEKKRGSLLGKVTPLNEIPVERRLVLPLAGGKHQIIDREGGYIFDPEMGFYVEDPSVLYHEKKLLHELNIF